MGFKDVQRRAIACLDALAFDSDIRDAMAEKNLLATGAISPADVRRLISRCNGAQYTAKPMTEAPSVLKHELKPVIAERQWFIRFYFVPGPTELLMFISVHPSSYPRG